MNHDHIEGNNVIDRLLMGQLPSAEAESFQEHMRDCASCLHDFSRAERMHQGIKELYATEATLAMAPRALWRALGTGKRALLVLAICLLVGPVLLLGYRLQGMKRELSYNIAQVRLRQQERTSPLVNVPILRPSANAVAGNPADFLVYLGSSPRWLVFVLETVEYESGLLGASLIDEAGKEVWTASGLEVNDRDETTIGIHTGNIHAGDYHLRLDGRSEDLPPVPITHFAFRAVP